MWYPQKGSMAMGSRRTLPTGRRGGGGLRAHGGAGVDAGGPVEGLVDERDGGGAAASEEKAAMGTPWGFSQSGSMVGHWLAGAVKRPLGCAAGVFLASGVQGLPRQSMTSAGASSVMPSHQTSAFSVGECDVGEDGVAVERRHGVGVGL